MKNKKKITIAIPAHNNEFVIEEAILSAINQDYPHKEILVIDDASTDRTALMARKYPQVRLIVNEKNLGIGLNLAKCINEARGQYILFLCADDVFTNPYIAGDVVQVFNKSAKLGVIGRYLYYFLHNKQGPIGTLREENILISSICPSGMAFRKMYVTGYNKIFIEMPMIVAQYLKIYAWTMFDYDTIAARFHPGGNTGTKEEYYTQSPWENCASLYGEDFKDYPIFIMLKNRAPKTLWKEIKTATRINPSIKKDWRFYLYVGVAILTPRFILRKVTVLKRDLIDRRKSKIIYRS